MLPLIVFVAVTSALRLVGAVGVDALDDWTVAVRGGLAVMLLLTASAHFAGRRGDLVAMVPPGLPNPELLVTVTGVLELVIAAALLSGPAAPWAAAGLIPLLVAMFPANVHAARKGIGIGGKPATPLPTRTAIQAVFIAAAAFVALAF